jgi:hypothetical protein
MKLKKNLVTIGVILVLAACTKISERSFINSSSSVDNSFYVNKFGAFPSKGFANSNPASWSGTQIGEDRIHSVAQANDLGVAYYRMSIIQASWYSLPHYKDSSIAEFVAAAVTNPAPLKVILNLNYEPPSGPKDFPTGANLTSYKTFVSNVLASCHAQGKYPYMVVVENEERQ